MAWILVTTSNLVDNKTTQLDDKITIGREPSNSLPIKKNEISRNHAEIYLDATKPMIVDLGSSNGSFLNGKKLEPNAPIALHHGDKILFEQVSFDFRSTDSSQTSVMRSLNAESNKTSVQKAIEVSTKLVLIKGDTTTGVKEFNLDGLDSLTAGRSPECQIVLADPTVSGKHAKFNKTSQGWEVMNLSQTNGLFINGQNIIKLLLNDKDNVELGGCILKFSSSVNSSFQETSGKIPDWLRNQE